MCHCADDARDLAARADALKRTSVSLVSVLASRRRFSGSGAVIAGAAAGLGEQQRGTAGLDGERDALRGRHRPMPIDRLGVVPGLAALRWPIRSIRVHVAIIAVAADG